MSNNIMQVSDFSEEEKKAIIKKQTDLLKWANSLTKEQINYLCDGGWYNNTIKGYLITAAKNADMNGKQIEDLLNGLRCAFSDLSKSQAEQVYINY